MGKIIKVLRPVKYGPKNEYVTVTVLTDEGEEASIWVGGEIETFFHAGRIKAHIKRNKTLTKDNNKRTLKGDERET